MKFIACLSFFLMANLSTALAGPSVTGGGKGVVCREPSGLVKSVELLDLWEARTLFRRTILKSNESVEVQVAAIAKKFSGETPGDFGGGEVSDILRRINIERIQDGANLFLGKPSKYFHEIIRLRGVTLALSEDSFEDAWPSDCSVEQIISFKPGVGIYINQDLYEKMDATNQAALIIHESLYSFIRFHTMKVKSSIRSRRAVGFVFAGGDFNTMPDPTIPHYSCSKKLENTTQEIFALFNDPKTGAFMSAVSGGYEETPFGFFPKKVRDLNDSARALNTIFSKEQCKHYKEGEYFMIASLGGAGPVDFDRGATLVGRCKQGKLQPYFSPEWFDEENKAGLVPIRCQLIKLPTL